MSTQEVPHSFQRQPRPNEAERCEIDNDLWTFGDGFQTLPKPSKPLQHKGSRPTTTAPTAPNPGPEGSRRASIESHRKKRDGFQTPSSDTSAPPTSTTSSPPTAQAQRSKNSPTSTGSIEPPSPQPSTATTSSDTLPKQSKPLQHRGSRPVRVSPRAPNRGSGRLRRTPSDRRLKIRDGFKPRPATPLPHRHRRLIAAYRAGASINELAHRYRLHRTTVAATLDRHHVERHHSQGAWTSKTLAAAADLYATGLSLAAVAARYGIDPQTVANRFHRAGIPVRTRRGWPPRRPT